MFIIGADVQNYVRISKMSAEWLELRVHIDNRKVETSQQTALLYCEYSLDQGGNVTIFETFNITELQV